jgi:hypothetical protein
MPAFLRASARHLELKSSGSISSAKNRSLYEAPARPVRRGSGEGTGGLCADANGLFTSISTIVP